ncbi:MAG: DNA-directed RNA polymerase subunit D, partial [Candidatus Nanohaloarchaea archaeon]|nr:DNA-directed RNA polymerase subunit D [Candidatus Nanohaloarchaea archaeon]
MGGDDSTHDVDFVNNTSGLFDEMVAHRIGMIPWRFPQDEYNVREECDCDGEGCTQCRVEFVLKKEGEGTVYASDLKPTDKEVETPNPDTVIVKLLEEQEVNLEARARLGYGTDHAKFQAANVSYKYYPVVRVNGEEVDNAEEAARVAPDAVRNAEGPVEADDDIVYAFDQTLDIEGGDEVELEERDDK